KDVVKVGAERFIIPTTTIRESLRPQEDEIKTIKQEGEMLHIRGRMVPLVWLDRVLNIANPHAFTPSDGLVVIVENDGKEYGFVVDDLLGQQHVVIKNLGARFKGIPGILGGTILGDGKVGLILDVPGIVVMN
ncbi:MAG: chemotaxis protein CheW, partial [Nitrospinota bacterium]